jgi:hypothetical protein
MIEFKDIENYQHFQPIERLEIFKEFNENIMVNRSISKPKKIYWQERFTKVTSTNFKRSIEITDKDQHFTLRDKFINTSFSGNQKAKIWRKRMIDEMQIISFLSIDYDVIIDIENEALKNCNQFLRVNHSLLDSQISKNQIINLSWRCFENKKDKTFKDDNFLSWANFYNFWVEYYYLKIHFQIVNI